MTLKMNHKDSLNVLHHIDELCKLAQKYEYHDVDVFISEFLDIILGISYQDGENTFNAKHILKRGEK